jgi:hypothetical protein
MSHSPVRCEHDGIKWYPRVTIEKYSIDQTAYAERQLAELKSWRRLPLLRQVYIGERASRVREEGLGHVFRLHGNWLRELFPAGPEDGYAYDEGNLLVNAGLTNLINLLTGRTGTAVNTLGSNATSVVGVGSSSTAAAVTDAALGGNGSSTTAWYQAQDANFPTITTPATINGQSTFASGNANFAWNEWCWATGAGAITAGATLASVFATASSSAMLNHKIPAGGLGTKASGASWVFSTTVVFS